MPLSDEAMVRPPFLRRVELNAITLPTRATAPGEYAMIRLLAASDCSYLADASTALHTSFALSNGAALGPLVAPFGSGLLEGVSDTLVLLPAA